MKKIILILCSCVLFSSCKYYRQKKAILVDILPTTDSLAITIPPGVSIVGVANFLPGKKMIPYSGDKLNFEVDNQYIFSYTIKPVQAIGLSVWPLPVDYQAPWGIEDYKKNNLTAVHYELVDEKGIVLKSGSISMEHNKGGLDSDTRQRINLLRNSKRAFKLHFFTDINSKLWKTLHVVQRNYQLVAGLDR